MDKPIFILGAHKSGSSLLRSLLDGHSELFVIPLETHLFREAGYWVDYRLMGRGPVVKPLAKVAEAYLENVERYNAHHKSFSDADLVGKFNLERVRAHLYTEQSDLSELIDSYVKGIYAGAFNRDMPKHLRIVEKSVEHAEFVQDLKTMYPDAKFLHIIRNPYAHLVSLRLMQAHYSNRRFPFLGKLLETLSNSFYYLYRNRRLINEYHIIRYEDLVIDPTQVMRDVADFLDIQFEDVLLEPTSLEDVWQGNSSRGNHFSGISAANIARWRNQITELEINLITRYFTFVLADFKYELIRPQRSIWWPVSSESPVIYLANRIIPYWQTKHPG